MKNQSTHASPFLTSLLLVLSVPLLFLSGCQSGQNKARLVEIVFAFGPDDGDSVQPLIDQFNEQNAGKIKVTWEQGSRSSNEFYQEVLNDLKSETPTIDVIAADVIWTPALASQGLVGDISSRFFETYNPQDFIEASMESATHQFKVWGVPWFTDAAMLYYRKDLLTKSGYQYPPATWDELIDYAKKIQAESGVKYGYVFQGAEYEGGVTNACEFIWNAGGNILLGDLTVSGQFDEATIDPYILTVNSDEVRLGLTEVQKLGQSGIIPENIHEYRELETGEAFQNGDAVFMRSWATAYGFVLDPDSKVKAEQVGMTPLPTSKPNMTPYSCLGGWNLMISAKSSEEEKNAAWEFLRHMTSAESQQYRALKGGILPSLRSLYSDEQLMKKVPVVSFARQVIPVSKKRPYSPYYMEMSPEIAAVFTKVVKGEETPDAAVQDLAVKLEAILNKYY